MKFLRSVEFSLWLAGVGSAVGIHGAITTSHPIACGIGAALNCGLAVMVYVRRRQRETRAARALRVFAHWSDWRRGKA